MKGFNATRKQRGDLRVKVYVSADLARQLDDTLVDPPVGKARRRFIGYAVQELVDTLIHANERGEKVNVTDCLVESVTLCQLASAPKSKHQRR